MQRETMEFDVIIIGAGPSGLSAAIRLAQLNQENQTNYSICVVEKGSEVGAHILSGAVLEPRALNELIPDWKEKGAPVHVEVGNEKTLYLTKQKSFSLPTPPPMRNHGNYIISLGNLCRWLAEQAENLNVDIFPGFPASDILYNEKNEVSGIITQDMGVAKDGNHTENYQPGMELRAKQTIFAEGCRGSLTETLFDKFDLRKDADPQTYGIGLKELWEIDENDHQEGTVIHTVGWPLDHKTYGGSFIYHLDKRQVAVGFVVGLDYQNPYLNPFKEFQCFKTHPDIRKIFESDTAHRISYGARALNEGGYQSIPKLSFPGGMIVGCGAGFLNVPKIKGSHTAMKSGMVAAETTFKALQENAGGDLNYGKVLKKTWVYKELHQVRNIRPAFRKGLWPGLLYAAFDTFILHGFSPWTFKNHADHRQLIPAKKAHSIRYPKPDGKITFDRLSSVYISNTNHEENQPSHLVLTDPSIAIDFNYQVYNSPETRYCPAGVYEIVEENGQPKFVINAQNCVHCKTCDIKDPKQNIKWKTPEGGGGPNYPNM